MIAGHFGFAAIVKGRERATPLWILMFASVWLDIVFVPLFLAHIETLQPVTNRGYGGSLIHAEYTHSLLGMLVLSALLGAICLPFWGKRSAIVIGLVAASHWILDLIVHRPDLPLLPGNAFRLPELGFGLWRYPLLSILAELILVAAGTLMYRRAAIETSLAAGKGTSLANAAAVLLALSGVVVLALDALS